MKLKLFHFGKKETIKLFNEIKKETKRTVITWVVLNEYLRENVKGFNPFFLYMKWVARPNYKAFHK